jgi:hypothetical protein
MFIGNTLRSYSPDGQRNVSLSRREFDTYVLFFYMLILRTRQSPGVRIVPDKDTTPEYPKNVASPSRRWDITLEADGSRMPSSPEALRTCPVSMSRQPQHEKIKET